MSQPKDYMATLIFTQLGLQKGFELPNTRHSNLPKTNCKHFIYSVTYFHKIGETALPGITYMVV